MQMSQNRQTVKTTDIRARKVGNFERHKLIGCGIYDFDGGIESVQKVTDAKYLILEFEAVDGTKVLPRPLTSSIMYDNQGAVMENILQNGYAYLNIGKGSFSMTDTKDKAQRLHNGDIKSTTYPVGFQHITKDIFLSMVDALQVSVGSRQTLSYDRDCSDKIHCSRVGIFEDIGMCEKLDRYLQMVKTISNGFEPAYVVRAENPNCLGVQIGSEVYDIYFKGRPDSRNHVPSMIAEEIGCGTFENVEGKEILVASGWYESRKNTYNVIGTNRSGILSLATPD